MFDSVRPAVSAQLAFRYLISRFVLRLVPVVWVALSTESAALAQGAPASRTEVVRPKLVSGVPPVYPDGAVGAANVLVEIVVGTDGRVASARAISGDPPFAAIATEAVAAYRFSPAQRQGIPVRARIRMIVTFEPPQAVVPPSPAPDGRGRPAPASSEGGDVRAPEQVSVTGQRYETQSPTEYRMGRAEVRLVPGAFGDPFRAIEIFPGVTPTLSGLPFYYVRGAPPAAVGYFVDEVRVPYLFHFGLGPGVIEPALIKEVALHPAAFPARYGRFSGAIVAAETTQPADKPHGEGAIRVYDAGAFVEAPLADGRVNVGVGGRVSYTALIASVLVPEASFAYRDYNARLTVHLTERTKLSAFTFGSFDYASVTKKDTGKEDVLFASEFHRLDVRLDHQGDRGHSRLAVTAGLDRSRLRGSRFARNHMLGFRGRHREVLNDWAELEAGADVVFDFYDGDLPSPFAVSRKSHRSALEFFSPRTDSASGAWVSALLRPTSGSEVTLTARADVFASAGRIAVGPSPRAAVRVPLTDGVAGLFALGIAPQPPAFAIPLPAVGYRGLPGGLSYAYQKSAGIEVKLPLSFVGTAVGFHHSYLNLRDIFTNPESVNLDSAKVLDDVGTQPNAPSQAVGLELLLRRRLAHNVAATVSYTLSRSTIGSTRERAGFVNIFDRAHVFQASLAFDLTHGWLVSARSLVYSGWPQAAKEAAGQSASRLPPFFRFDGRVEKRWAWGTGGHVSLLFEGMNVTASEEVVGQACDAGGKRCETQAFGPLVVPSIGLEGAQ